MCGGGGGGGVSGPRQLSISPTIADVRKYPHYSFSYMRRVKPLLSIVCTVICCRACCFLPHAAEALVAVGHIDTHCKLFYCRDVRSKGGCCIRDLDSWMPADIDLAQFPINVYGEDPVNITVEAIWLNHYPFDLKIQVLDNYSTSEMVRTSGIYIFL